METRAREGDGDRVVEGFRIGFRTRWAIEAIMLGTGKTNFNLLVDIPELKTSDEKGDGELVKMGM